MITAKTKPGSDLQRGRRLGSAGALQTAPSLSASDTTALWARTVVPWPALVAAALLSLVLGAGLYVGLAGERSSLAPAVRSHTFSHKGLLSLPLAAQGPVSAAMGAANPAYRLGASGGGFAGASPAQRLNLRFDRAGVSLSSGKTHIGLTLRAVGYGSSLSALGEVTPQLKASRVLYERAGLSEWYVNGPLGLEQGFTIARAPSGHPAGALTLSMALSGNVHALLASGGQGITLSRAGATSLRYGGLSATDANGRVLHSWLSLHAGRLLLRVDARTARYPLRIDPLIQQGEKLTAKEESGTGEFGYSVALSSDGNTALIGGPGGYSNNGVDAAWVFTRSKSTWAEQQKLTGGGEISKPPYGGGFGHSVALSSDGNTALIGAYQDNGGAGAAWVFTRPEFGSAYSEGQKLTVSAVNPQFGFSVALSGTGNTALIGGPYDNFEVGAAWVFTRPEFGSAYTEGQKLTGTGAAQQSAFGFSVALSGDGTTALIGGAFDNKLAGAAWVFARSLSGSTWAQQSEKLTGGEEINVPFGGEFGFSVALSGDGSTALIGGIYDNKSVGATWVFARLGTTWAQQQKLTASDEGREGYFGHSVALSADGNTALIGGYHDWPEGTITPIGAVWVFTRSVSNWAQQEKLAGGGEVGDGAFGSSVALSSDASTALTGGPFDNTRVGAAWVLGPAAGSPTVQTIIGKATGTTTATLYGLVNPQGNTTTYSWQYATDATFSSTGQYDMSTEGLEKLPALEEKVHDYIEALQPGTTYHFRITATNAAGTSYGVDKTFTTTPTRYCGTTPIPVSQYCLTVELAGKGTVKDISYGIVDCGGAGFACVGSYPNGTMVTLTETPEPGETFSSWSGCLTTSGTQCTVTMGADQTVTATFTGSGITSPITVWTGGSSGVLGSQSSGGGPRPYVATCIEGDPYPPTIAACKAEHAREALAAIAQQPSIGTASNILKQGGLVTTITAQGPTRWGVLAGGYLISDNGSSLISDNGSSLVSDNGSTLISDNGSGFISAGAGNFISAGAGNVIAAGAGNFISAGAGNILSGSTNSLASLTSLTTLTTPAWERPGELAAVTARKHKQLKPVLLMAGGHTFDHAGAARVKLLLTPAGKKIVRRYLALAQRLRKAHKRVPKSHLALVFVVADRGGNGNGKPPAISVMRLITLKP